LTNGHIHEADLGSDFVELLALDGNGAVEASLPQGEPLRVVLIGPIKTWWGRMDSPEYKQYSAWRDAVRATLIYHGCLVYAPHRAWSGAWHESAQRVNDAAILESDVVVTVTPPGVEASGTAAEVAVAEKSGVAVIHCPPGTQTDILNLTTQLDLILNELDSRKVNP
jgi:hypothetical protein